MLEENLQQYVGSNQFEFPRSVALPHCYYPEVPLSKPSFGAMWGRHFPFVMLCKMITMVWWW